MLWENISVLLNKRMILSVKKKNFLIKILKIFVIIRFFRTFAIAKRKDMQSINYKEFISHDFLNIKELDRFLLYSI